jgi:hypothetical protein
MKLYMFRTLFMSIIRSLFTVHSVMVYAIQVCRNAFEQDQDGTVLLESCLQTCMTYTVTECTVNKFLMVDRRNAGNMWSFMTK